MCRREVCKGYVIGLQTALKEGNDKKKSSGPGLERREREGKERGANGFAGVFQEKWTQHKTEFSFCRSEPGDDVGSLCEEEARKERPLGHG